jgi:hypothetical protein
MKRTIGILGMLVGAGVLLWVLMREPERAGTAWKGGAVESAENAPLSELVPATAAREPVAGLEPRQVVRIPTHQSVIAGQVIRFEDLQEPGQVPEVPIAGLVHVPEAWELSEFQLMIQLLEGLDPTIPSRSTTLASRYDLEPLPHAPGYFSFAVEGGPGRYRFFLAELAHETIVDVGLAGCTDLRIEPPEPQVLRVECVESASGAMLLPGRVRVRWTGVVDDGLRINRLVDATWKDELGVWLILAPKQSLKVMAEGEGLLGASTVVAAPEEAADVTLKLAPAFELSLALHEAGKPVPWNPELRARLVPAGGQSDEHTVALSAMRCRLVQHAGGPYLLEVTTPEGYQPIAPVMIELVGPKTEHVVHVVRH